MRVSEWYKEFFLREREKKEWESLMTKCKNDRKLRLSVIKKFVNHVVQFVTPDIIGVNSYSARNLVAVRRHLDKVKDYNRKSQFNKIYIDDDPLIITCIRHLKSYMCVGMIEILIDEGLNVNDKTIDTNSTALHVASSYGYIGVVKILMVNGVDVNAVAGGRLGDTALMKASDIGSTEIAKILIDAGADVNAVDNYGDTSLKLVSKHGHTEIENLLIEAGAK